MTHKPNEKPSFKNLLKLTHKKHRRELGLCIIEGEKTVREHKDTAAAIYRRGVDLDEKQFNQISYLENGQGIFAVVPIPKPHGISFPYLVLDGLQDPGNVGTVLRTAAAFGFHSVFCINCADVWSQKVLRAGMGTQFSLNIYELDFDEFKSIYESALKGGILYIADLDGDKILKKPSGDFGLVLGNEGQGISAQIKSLAHKVVTIPIEPCTESLNVAVAGAIIMYSFKKE